MNAQTGTPAFGLDAILRGCVDGLYIVDPARRYVEFSAGCERITGFNRESVLGSRCSCRQATDCRVERGRSLVGALCPGLHAFSDRAGSFKQRTRIRRPDGRSVPVETTFSRIASENADSTYLVGVMRDMTDVVGGDAGDHDVTELDMQDERPGPAGDHSSESDAALMADRPDGPGESDAPSSAADSSLGALDRMLSGIERNEIVRALRRSRGQRMMAARVLGISRSRLYRRMEALGIDPRRVAANLDET